MLTLLFNEKLLTQSERKTLNDLILVSQLVAILTSNAKVLRS